MSILSFQNLLNPLFVCEFLNIRCYARLLGLVWREFIADFIYVATNLALSFSGVLGVRLASS